MISIAGVPIGAHGTTLMHVTEALLAFAAPRKSERVSDVGCDCGAPTLDFARAAGHVAALNVSGPMLTEG